LKSKQVQEFKERELGELITIIIDHRGKTPKKLGGDWTEHGIPVISAKNIAHTKLSRLEEIRFITKEMAEKWMPVKLERNDVLITSEGATLGEVAILRQVKNYCIGQRLFAIRCDPELLDPYYFYYYLISDRGQHEIFSRATGSTVEGLRQYEVKNILVIIPLIENQKKIGKILSDLDSKIENLEKLNKILEQMAQAIFKSWFVDFDGITDFEDSELGPIPKGWNCEILDSFLERITYGFTCPMQTSESGPYMVTAKDLKGNKINYDTVRRTTEDSYKNKLTDKSRPKYNDILLSKDGTLGRLAIVKNEKICINQSIALLQPNSRITTNFLYMLLLTPIYQQKMIMDADGTTIQHIYITRVNKMFILVPKIEILNKFEKHCRNIFMQIDSNLINILNLTQIRDILLPKLMSGEIRV